MSSEDAEELGRELVEAVREGTDLSWSDSQTTVSAVVATLRDRLALGSELGAVLTALESDSLVDVERSGDADRCRQLSDFLSGLRQDSQERSWALHENSASVLEALQLLAELWGKADRRVPLHHLSTAEFRPLYDLVELHQMETRPAIRSALGRALLVGLGLSPLVASVAAASVLPTELGRELVEKDAGDDELLALQLLTKSFATAESLPYTHYGSHPSHIVHPCIKTRGSHLAPEILNSDFVTALLDLGESAEDDLSKAAHSCIVAFSLHFPSSDSLVTDTLKHCGGGRQRLSQNIVSMLNQEKDPVWEYDQPSPAYASSVLRFLRQLLEHPSQLGAEVLYSQDADVLLGVLLRQTTDSGPSRRRSECLGVVEAVLSATDWAQGRATDFRTLLLHLRGQEQLPDEDRQSADRIEALL